MHIRLCCFLWVKKVAIFSRGLKVNVNGGREGAKPLASKSPYPSNFIWTETAGNDLVWALLGGKYPSLPMYSYGINLAPTIVSAARETAFFMTTFGQ